MRSSFCSSYYKKELLENVVSVLETVKKQRHSRVDARTNTSKQDHLDWKETDEKFHHLLRLCLLDCLSVALYH